MGSGTSAKSRIPKRRSSETRYCRASEVSRAMVRVGRTRLLGLLGPLLLARQFYPKVRQTHDCELAWVFSVSGFVEHRPEWVRH